MEPVQRLPRYSLFIDTMTALLPSTHVAVKPLLKARDIITEICSLDSSSNTDDSQILKRLKLFVSSWPPSILPRGRLITAVDFAEVMPPFRTDNLARDQEDAVLLLYPDSIVLISRVRGGKLSARGLLAELDKPTPLMRIGEEEVGPSPPELIFSESIQLEDAQISQSTCGRLLFLTYIQRDKRPALKQAGIRSFLLSGSYHTKAARLGEEIVKARIEGRFSEAQREDGKWTLRSPALQGGSPGILASVFEDDGKGSSLQSGPANIAIMFDMPKAARARVVGKKGIDVFASISKLPDGRFRLEIDGLYGVSTTDHVAEETFGAVFSKRRKLILHL